MKSNKFSLLNGICLFLLLGWHSVQAQAGVDRNLAYPRFVGELDGDDVAQQVYFANHFFAFNNISVKHRGHTLSVLIDKSKNGDPIIHAVERHLNNNYDEEDAILSRDLTIFYSGHLHGTGILITDYKDDTKNTDYSTWLPELGEIEHVAQPPHDEAWGDSVFTFGDMTLRKPDDETHKLLGIKKMRTCLGIIVDMEGDVIRYNERVPKRSCRQLNRDVYGLKSTTKFKDWWYDYRISYVDTEHFADYRTLYYKKGRLIKVIDRDWGLVNPEGGGDPRELFWKYWYGVDLRTGKESLLVVPHKLVEINSDRRNSFWTEKTLRKIDTEGLLLK